MELSRQEYWSGLPFPSSGDLSNLGLPHSRYLINSCWLDDFPWVPAIFFQASSCKWGMWLPAVTGHTLITSLSRKWGFSRNKLKQQQQQTTKKSTLQGIKSVGLGHEVISVPRPLDTDLARFEFGAYSWGYRGGCITKRWGDKEIVTIFRTVGTHWRMFKLWMPSV